MQDKISKNKNSKRTGNFSYGGFKYRLSYDNYLRSENKKADKLKKRGKRNFAVSVLSLFGLCVLTLAGVFVSDSGVLSGGYDSCAPAFVNFCDGRKYDKREFGDFACESVSDDGVNKYHLPKGVVLTYVSEFPEYHYNDGKLEEGDIIVSADGIQITCVDDFYNFASKCETSYLATLDIYRKGDTISVEYVIN